MNTKMGNVINFKNLETNIDISLPLDKSLIIVFGKNGSGKTTLSRNAPNRNCVFNTDFIHKTIYIENSDGANDDSKTKESFSELWVGEKIVNIKKELDILKRDKNEITKVKQELILLINNVFAENGIQFPQYGIIEKRFESITFVKDENQKDEEIIEKYKSCLSYDTQIVDDKQLEQSILSYKNNELMQLLIKGIKENPILGEVIFSDSTSEKQHLLDTISKYNCICENIKTIDTCYKYKDASKEEAWIKLALEIHKDASYCYFCDNPNIDEAIEKWSSIIKSKAKEELGQINDYLEKLIKSTEVILANKESFAKIANQTISSIDKYYNYLLAIKQNIIKREKINDDISFPEIIKDDLIVEGNKLLESIQNYIFKPYSSKYEVLCLLLRHYDAKVLAKEKLLETEMKKEADEISQTINDHLRELDFDKELKIIIEKRGNDKKYRFGFVNASTKINTLSDGQRHKLALAIFFASIEKMDLSDKVVVLDDPIVTLDYRSYHSIKRKIIDLRTKQNPKTIIVLTCNIDYLYIQLSNLFNSTDAENDVELYHIRGDGIKQVDYNIINYDDLSLYQAGLRSIKSYEEFSLVSSLNIRICRMFLDLYLRMHGCPSNGNPNDEIKAIGEKTEAEKKSLAEYNQKITKLSRDTDSTNSGLYESFCLTNEFVKALGFPQLIDDSILKSLSSFSDNDKRKSTYSGDSLLFLIIKRANRVLNSRNSKYESLKNYMNHPRTQLTSSIVGVDFSDLEEDNI